MQGARHGGLPTSCHKNIEREQEFEELKNAINRVFGSDKVENFLRRVRGNDARVRDLETVLARGILERVDPTLERAQSLYQPLTISDQAQLREFYHSKVEEVEPRLPTKFQQLYRYY